jgi:hypothetical protein
VYPIDFNTTEVDWAYIEILFAIFFNPSGP